MICPKCKKLIANTAIKCKYCFCEIVPDITDDFFITSTAGIISGYEVIENLGFVYGEEQVMGESVAGFLLNGLESSTDLARKKALEKIVLEAKKIGANAIIGLDLDLSEKPGNWVNVSASGTAVYVIPNDYEAKRLEFKNNMLALQKLEAEEIQKAAEEKERALLSINSNLENLVSNNELSPVSISICKMLIKNPNLNGMDIVKSFPKNVLPEDITTSLRELVDRNIIEKDDSGHYHVIQ